jgi:hypothetical protein
MLKLSVSSEYVIPALISMVVLGFLRVFQILLLRVMLESEDATFRVFPVFAISIAEIKDREC